jgi:hypothetical protein
VEGISDGAQYLLLNILAFTFIQSVNDDNQRASGITFSTWVNDQPLELYREGSVDDCRIIFHTFPDGMLQLGKENGKLICDGWEQPLGVPARCMTAHEEEASTQATLYL